MIECIDDIRTKIETVKSKTDNSIVDEENINVHLDEILVVKKIVDGMASDIDNLVEDLYVFFNENPSVESYLELKPNLKSLYRIASKYYDRVRESRYFNDVKTSIEEYRLSIAGLEEIIHDLDLFRIELPNDDKFKKLAEQFNEIFA